jgi:hypothetical protein
MSTVTKSKQQKDLQRAEQLMKAFKELQAEKEALEAKHKEKISPVLESLKEAEAELIDIGKRNRKAFDDKNNLVLDHGYIHIADKTTVIYGKEFSWKRFVSKFPDHINMSPKIALLKKAFTDADARKPFEKLDIDLKQEEVFQVIAK